jgi:hypothetical protein
MNLVNDSLMQFCLSTNKMYVFRFKNFLAHVCGAVVHQICENSYNVLGYIIKFST